MKQGDCNKLWNRLTELPSNPIQEDAKPWPAKKKQEPPVMLGHTSMNPSDNSLKVVTFDKIELCSKYGSIIHWNINE